MVSWGLTTGFILIAFLIPYSFNRMRLRRMKEELERAKLELHHLRLRDKETERRLQQDKALFLEALGVPFLIMRPSGRLIMANALAGALLGIDEKKPMNLLRVLEASAFRNVLEHAANAAEPWMETVDIQTTAKSPVPETRNYQIISTPLNNGENHIGIVFHDVTGEHRTQIMRRDFVANASHELRTPLTIIRGYLENLLEDEEMGNDPATRNHVLDLMMKHTQRIVRLVEDMLVISRLETPETGYLQNETFDLCEIAEDVALRLESLGNHNGATISIDISPTHYHLTGDKFYWTQVLFNLMENALKQNPAPGLHLRLEARDSGNKHIIRVVDDGIGIPAEHLPYIFNRFYRVQQSGPIKGTGLGLSIVRRAVEAHHGTIGATSIPGKETAFTIELPIDKNATR